MRICRVNTSLVRVNKVSIDAPWADSCASMHRNVSKAPSKTLQHSKSFQALGTGVRDLPTRFLMPELLPKIKWTTLTNDVNANLNISDITENLHSCCRVCTAARRGSATKIYMSVCITHTTGILYLTLSNLIFGQPKRRSKFWYVWQVPTCIERASLWRQRKAERIVQVWVQPKSILRHKTLQPWGSMGQEHLFSNVSCSFAQLLDSSKPKCPRFWLRHDPKTQCCRNWSCTSHPEEKEVTLHRHETTTIDDRWALKAGQMHQQTVAIAICGGDTKPNRPTHEPPARNMIVQLMV